MIENRLTGMGDGPGSVSPSFFNRRLLLLAQMSGPGLAPPPVTKAERKIMMASGFHLRTRPRMYAMVTLMCGMSALLLQFMLSGASQFKNYAELRLESAVHQSVRAQVEEVAQERK